MKANHVPTFLVRKFFTQIFCFINVQLFNALLLRREVLLFQQRRVHQDRTLRARELAHRLEGTRRQRVGGAAVHPTGCAAAGDSPKAEEDAQRDHPGAVPRALHPAAVSHQHDVLGRQVRHGDGVAGGAGGDEGAHDEGPEHEHVQLVPPRRRQQHSFHHRRHLGHRRRSTSAPSSRRSTSPRTQPSSSSASRSDKKASERARGGRNTTREMVGGGVRSRRRFLRHKRHTSNIASPRRSPPISHLGNANTACLGLRSPRP